MLDARHFNPHNFMPQVRVRPKLLLPGHPGFNIGEKPIPERHRLSTIVVPVKNGKEGIRLLIFRGDHLKEKEVRVGPNMVHAFIQHPDGDIKDLGVSRNLLTNIGRDVVCGLGGFIGGGITTDSPSTGISATSITATGTPYTASNLGTPQLGLAGMRVWAAPHTTTNRPVYGNIVSNTNAIITVDKWWNPDDTTGTTPTSGDGFAIGPGGLAAVRFMALTTNSSAASASNTTLASEITGSGAQRALATYAHTFGNATFTLQKAFSISALLTAIHRMGLFCALTAAGADPMVFETVLNTDATVNNGDTLTVTDTVTVSG